MERRRRRCPYGSAQGYCDWWTSFKADSGLKPGFLNTIEEALRAKLPKSCLKAIQHINSPVQQFIIVHSIMHDMVVEKCTT